jgi:hypothetical protein
MMLRFRNKPLRDQPQYGTFTPGTPLVDPDAAVHSLLQAFPQASPTFLRWAVAHHLASKPPPYDLDIIVDAVSEKIRKSESSSNDKGGERLEASSALS